MHDKDAAAYLKVTTRTLHRYRTSGKLPYKEVPGKTRSIIEYDAADIARLKEALDRRRTAGPKPKGRPVPAARRVTFGLSPEALGDLTKEAARYGGTVPEYARRLVREGLESRFRTEADELRAEVKRLTAEVSRVRKDFAAGFEAVLEFVGLSPEEAKQWVTDNLR